MISNYNSGVFVLIFITLKLNKFEHHIIAEACGAHPGAGDVPPLLFRGMVYTIIPTPPFKTPNGSKRPEIICTGRVYSIGISVPSQTTIIQYCPVGWVTCPFWILMIIFNCIFQQKQEPNFSVFRIRAFGPTEFACSQWFAIEAIPIERKLWEGTILLPRRQRIDIFCYFSIPTIVVSSNQIVRFNPSYQYVSLADIAPPKMVQNYHRSHLILKCFWEQSQHTAMHIAPTWHSQCVFHILQFYCT